MENCRCIVPNFINDSFIDSLPGFLEDSIWLHFFVQKKTNKRFGTPRTNGDVPRRGSTLAESSDENIGLISGMSARSLTALRHFEIGKSAPLYFRERLSELLCLSLSCPLFCLPLFLQKRFFIFFVSTQNKKIWPKCRLWNWSVENSLRTAKRHWRACASDGTCSRIPRARHVVYFPPHFMGYSAAPAYARPRP